MGSGSVRARAETGSSPNPSGRRPARKHHAGRTDRSRFDRRQTTRRIRSSSSDRSPPQTKKDGFDVHPTRLTSRRMTKVSRACCVCPRGAKQKAFGAMAFRRRVPNDSLRWTRVIAGRLNAAPLIRIAGLPPAAQRREAARSTRWARRLVDAPPTVNLVATVRVPSDRISTISRVQETRRLRPWQH